MRTRRRVGTLLMVALAAVLATAADPAGANVPTNPPREINVVVGEHVGGNRDDLRSSDDQYYLARSTDGRVPKVRAVATWDNLNPNDNTLQLLFEASADPGCEGTIEAFDFQARRWETVFTGALTPSDQQVLLNLDAAQYVSNTGRAKLRLTCTSGSPFVARLDVLSLLTYNL